ncbi:glutathione-dependent formaldehyde dehydrogenase [Sphingomonas sp. ABOLF]|uniref:zinc-dependent alcohol dehydrogenase n=1 Tax=Sphingomonas sp. ABOLF TaxID=1985879 RepID=UPI000F7E7AC9|nr:zinc-dependent alcohol dehydrogenase [Sphingomonas sp. ABOLF]RSV14876.1 glutathione-dependent formaldehyde dehydrogenase [Sphingomonas sp. ABOLF]
MKAVVFHAIGDIRLEDAPEPVIEQPTDAIVRLTMSAICGTDLHFVRGTFSGVAKGQILGHEGVGIVERVGAEVRTIKVGQRVIIPSTVGCGHCQFCERGFFAQCDNANPQGKRAGTVFFGGPEAAGNLKGLQAELARCPWADTNLVPVPDEISNEQAILLSDILPTGWFGADLAEIEPGDHVLVLGCGPVGQMAIASAIVKGGKVIAVDRLPDRLDMARGQDAEVINFDEVDVPEAVLKLTNGDGARRVIDAVGVDAQHAHAGPDEPGVLGKAKELAEQYVIEPTAKKFGSHFVAGDNPSQALDWAVECAAKGGTISIIGVYPPTDKMFPIGMAMNKNLTLRMGNCNHRRYYDVLIDHVRSGRLDPVKILTQTEPMTGAIEAYKAFDERQPGWIKVELEPAS